MEGSITINGLERNLSSFRKLSCYIMQDNQLHGNLTVEEAMAVATSLKLPSATTRADRDEVVCLCSHLSLWLIFPQARPRRLQLTPGRLPLNN